MLRYLPTLNPSDTSPISVIAPFSAPMMQKTIWVAGHQHYVCGTWRGTMWHTTNLAHPKRKQYVLCVSADKRAVWCSDEGNFSGDPFPLPPEILARMPNAYEVA